MAFDDSTPLTGNNEELDLFKLHGVKPPEPAGTGEELDLFKLHGIKPPEPAEPGFLQKAKSTGRALSEGISQSWPQFKGQFAAALEGGRPLDGQDWKDKYQAEAEAQAQRFQTEPGAQDPTLLGANVGQFKGEIAQTLPQIAGNVGGMLAGAATGALTGARAWAHWLAALQACTRCIAG
jgi:hypothetical protein